MYTDDSKEFEKARIDLEWPGDAATPYRPETNGVAEKAVRRVKEGTSAALVQSGFDEHWWDLAMLCYCFLRNIVDLVVSKVPIESIAGSDPTPVEAAVIAMPHMHRFRAEFRGPVYPFGCFVQCVSAARCKVDYFLVTANSLVADGLAIWLWQIGVKSKTPRSFPISMSRESRRRKWMPMFLKGRTTSNSHWPMAR